MEAHIAVTIHPMAGLGPKSDGSGRRDQPAQRLSGFSLLPLSAQNKDLGADGEIDTAGRVPTDFAE